MKAADRIFVALDFADMEEVHSMIGKLSGHVGGFKLGLEFFVSNGPEKVKFLADSGLNLFLDLKFHDIPNTVAGAVRAATATGANIINIHASGGMAMMRAAAEAANESARSHGFARPLVVAVTVLTSIDETELMAMGSNTRASDQVLRLAHLAKFSGLDGVVCSATESAKVRDDCGDNFIRIVPGIRPTWALANDQKRTETPKHALANGATYLVIGRPVTHANDPLGAVSHIISEIETE